MTRTKLRKRCILPFLALCFAAFILPAQAQDEGNGHGVVRFALPPNVWSIISAEASLADLLYPRLFGTDSREGLALETLPIPLSDDEVLIHLRPNQTWSDGEPITSYDVLYSFLAQYDTNWTEGVLHELAGVRVVDDQTIALRFASTDEEIAELSPDITPLSPTCDDLPLANIYIAPWHYFAPNFHDFMDSNTPEGGGLPSLEAWREVYHRYQNEHPLASPTGEWVTGGSYRIAETDNENNARVTPTDGVGPALVTITTLPPTSDRLADVLAFIAGDLDLLFNPPFEQRSALRALADPNVRAMQIAEVPGSTSLVVQLNFANPLRPLPGFHPETGEALDQGQHPIFSDLNVRRALQLTIDQDAIIDGVFQQSAERLSGLLPPSSWAYDPTLEPLETDIAEANRLLEEAGWHDSNGDGIRECIRCQTAAEGRLLQFTLGLADNNLYYYVANELAEQWSRIGVYVDYYGGETSALVGQTFDAYLKSIGGTLDEDNDPDRSNLLTPVGDVLNVQSAAALWNYGSYDNPEVTRLLQEARTVPTCSITERAEIYHRLEHLLQDDLPFLFVVAPNEFYAAAPGVLGFAPRSGDPLWNVESWVVSP